MQSIHKLRSRTSQGLNFVVRKRSTACVRMFTRSASQLQVSRSTSFHNNNNLNTRLMTTNRQIVNLRPTTIVATNKYGMQRLLPGNNVQRTQSRKFGALHASSQKNAPRRLLRSNQINNNNNNIQNQNNNNSIRGSNLVLKGLNGQQKRDLHAIPPLSFHASDGLMPCLSAKAIESHYFGHLTYHTRRLNELVVGTPYEYMDLMDTIQMSSQDARDAAIFNNASQIINHDIFFNGMTPGGTQPGSEVQQLICSEFGSMDEFQNLFMRHALGVFGSGYTWLVANGDRLQVMSTFNAQSPFLKGQMVWPLLCLDMWEHAYYLDHQYDKRRYVKTWWEVIDWDYAARRLLQYYPIKDQEALARDKFKKFGSHPSTQPNPSNPTPLSF